MKEAYCSYEVCKLLKEKGFDWETNWYYDLKGACEPFSAWVEAKPYEYSPMPTHQMAMAWLRKNHNICITIYPDKENGYEAVLYDIEDDVEIVLQSFGVYGIHIYEEIYEDAVEAALKYSLENLI